MKKLALTLAIIFIFCGRASAQLDSNWYAVDNFYEKPSTNAWCYSNAAVAQTVGLLTLTESNGSYSCQSQSAVPYQTGMVVSKTFSFQYGVVEASIRFGSPGNTLASALWMWGGGATSSGYPSTCVATLMAGTGTPMANCTTDAIPSYEIDIADVYSSDSQFNSNYYVWQTASKTSTYEYTNTGVGNISTRYNTFKLQWFPDRLVFSVNGVTYNTIAASPAAPMFLLFDQELAYTATSYPVTSTMQWVRVCSDPNAACQPGDPATIFSDTFGYPPAVTPVAKQIQGITSQGVSSQ